MLSALKMNLPKIAIATLALSAAAPAFALIAKDRFLNQRQTAFTATRPVDGD